ncbi:MAG: 4'-phosphopantetheinyl transferase superfamily protein [Planctomycetaceae bacterium]|nr:4'-phosphopantetheinyl transferase superfamily protein [Planctomycetaceae bacterium]
MPVVDLWYADYLTFAAEDSLAALAATLDDDERTRMTRFLFERDRRSYAISHGLLRIILSAYAAVEPSLWRYRHNDYGKPEIAEPAQHCALRFNLSHTRGAMLCGVTRDGELGVDVEATARDASCVELADRYFSPSEVADLRRLPIDARRDRFFRLWTLKEAYIKARGMGLAIPLDQFSYAFSDGEPTPTVRISFAPPLIDDPQNWQFTERRMTPSFRAAAAVAAFDRRPATFVWRRIKSAVRNGGGAIDSEEF